MSEPTSAVRAATYERDEGRCVSCGSLGPLQYQHRAVEGMGGRVAAPKLEEGLTSCPVCNPAYEGHLRALAVTYGWKVPTWVRDQDLAAAVPVFYAWEGRWCRLTTDGQRIPIFRSEAMAMMRAVYGDDHSRGAAA